MTLSVLTQSGWIATDQFSTAPCDVCTKPATFVRMNAPDCNTWALAGVGGSHSDAYSVTCSAICRVSSLSPDWNDSPELWCECGAVCDM